MEDAEETLPDIAGRRCVECGKQELERREGIYYCKECNTKLDHVPTVIDDGVDKELNNDTNKSTKQKSKKSEGPQLTAWECYNYILRGYVDKLIAFGAKEELKLVTLQVWAAYLKSMKVAFYNNKKHENPIQLENDTESNKNHSMEANKKRKRNNSDDDTSSSSDAESIIMNETNYPQRKRQLNASIHDKTSNSEDTSSTSSISSGNTTKVILDIDVKPRSYSRSKRISYKMEVNPATREQESTMILINLKQIYCVLGIALNLIQDDIQLCDLIRFANEGLISPNYALQYFPATIPKKTCKDILSQINFHKNPTKYTEKPIREHAGAICKNIGIEKLKTPDIVKLIRRYVTELCLPTEIATYCERLINICLPEFGTRSSVTFPPYEARAMAYIIFVLKLIFGLDGEKENCMSKASMKLNRKIEQLNRRHDEKQPLLFVWNEWVQFIEMRKVIVAHFNSNFREQFKQCQSAKQVLEQMVEEDGANNNSSSKSANDVEFRSLNQRLKNFRIVFARYQESFNNIATKGELQQMPKIKFKPSLKPGFSSFKTILRHYKNDDSFKAKINIPKFMHIDHAQRDINAYLKVKPLIEYFQDHHKELKTYVLPSTQNRNYIGVFTAPRTALTFGSTLAQSSRTQKACFDISEEKWSESIAKTNCNKTDDLEYKTDLDFYSKEHLAKTKPKKFYDENMDYELPTMWKKYHDQNTSSNAEHLLDGCDLNAMHSFDLFKENNMDPIKSENFINTARRDLNQIDLFADDDESVLNLTASQTIVIPSNSDDEVYSNFSKETHIKQEEFLDIEDTKDDKSKTNKDKTLKLYISNMDCWMLLGGFSALTKGQRAQLQDKFPRSFFWLLETCAQTLNVEWSAIYDQLLIIEFMFCLRIEDPAQIKDCVYMKPFYPIKDFQTFLHNCRKHW